MPSDTVFDRTRNMKIWLLLVCQTHIVARVVLQLLAGKASAYNRTPDRRPLPKRHRVWLQQTITPMDQKGAEDEDTEDDEGTEDDDNDDSAFVCESSSESKPKPKPITKKRGTNKKKAPKKRGSSKKQAPRKQAPRKQAPQAVTTKEQQGKQGETCSKKKSPI